MNTRRYKVCEGRGGKYRRFYVWDAAEKRVRKGMLGKAEAIELEHELNGRKFLLVKKSDGTARRHSNQQVHRTSGGRAAKNAALPRRR